MNLHKRRRILPLRILVSVSGLAIVVAALSAAASAQRPPSPPAAGTAPPIDLTGYWVSIVTEEWRWRMLTPPKGDYSSVPLNEAGRKVTDAWDLAKDEQRGEVCKPFGVGNIMRMPGRLHITAPDAKTLKLEFDAGTQTRLLHVGGTRPPRVDPTWQGSIAEWETADPIATDRNGIPTPGGQYVAKGGGPGGSLHVVTTNMRDGYLRKNGVPYSAGAAITEYFDRVGPEPNGDVMLLVRTVVEDPKYLQQPFITSTHFKQEPDGSKWNPTPCKIDPPVIPGQP